MPLKTANNQAVQFRRSIRNGRGNVWAADDAVMGAGCGSDPAGMLVVEEWVGLAFLGPMPSLPFSFVNGDAPSAKLLKPWHVKGNPRKLDEQRTENHLSHEDPKSLF